MKDCNKGLASLAIMGAVVATVFITTDGAYLWGGLLLAFVW